MSSTPNVPNPNGRTAAVAYTSQFKPGTVGHVVHHAIRPFETAFGSFASGNINQHYLEKHEALGQPNTDRNLELFAKDETAYWNEQPGLPGMIGSALSAQTRTKVLLCVKTQQAKTAKEEGE